MRLPVNNPNFDSNKIISQTVVIDDIPDINYYDSDIPTLLKEDYKFRLKYVKKVENFVRQSGEYKEYINFLKFNLNMSSCTFFKNLNSDEYEIPVEIHHAPFTLFDITNIVLEYYLQKGKFFSMFQVANRVTELHYMGCVGLIPLSETVHKLVHSGDIFIPIQYVYGNIKKFYNMYSPYIENELISVLEKVIEASRLFNDDYKPDVLQRKFTYLNIDGMELPKPIEVEQVNIA